MIDTIIIGAGPAGISAAIYLKRFNRDILVISKDGGILEGVPSFFIDNYYGMAHTTNNTIYKNSLEQLKQLSIKHLTTLVINIEQEEKGFIIHTNDGIFTAKTVLLATGAARINLPHKHLKDYIGRGVSFCAVCDSFFFKDKKLAVIGYNNFMKHELEVLNNVSNDVIVLTDGHGLECQINNKCDLSKIKDIIVDKTSIKKIITESATYDIDGIFIAIGAPSILDFANQLGLITNKNSLVVNENFQTNILGIFGAGDVIGGIMQITKCSYDGMMVAYKINDYLKK